MVSEQPHILQFFRISHDAIGQRIAHRRRSILHRTVRNQIVRTSKQAAAFFHRGGQHLCRTAVFQVAADKKAHILPAGDIAVVGKARSFNGKPRGQFIFSVILTLHFRVLHFRPVDDLHDLIVIIDPAGNDIAGELCPRADMDILHIGVVADRNGSLFTAQFALHRKVRYQRAVYFKQAEIILTFLIAVIPKARRVGSPCA